MQPTLIEWCKDRNGRKGYVWNVYHGCLNGCSWCYARRMAKRLGGRAGYPKDDPFRPVFDMKKIYEPLEVSRPSRIFVGSMGELWGPWFTHGTRDVIMSAICKSPQHSFIMLTKNPDYMVLYQESEDFQFWPKNLWLGVSVTGDDDEARLYILKMVNHPNKIVSFEPLLAPVADNGWFTLEGIKWVIIGAQTGPGGHQPDQQWVAQIMNQADGLGIPIFLKNNLAYNHDRHESPKEFP